MQRSGGWPKRERSGVDGDQQKELAGLSIGKDKVSDQSDYFEEKGTF